MDLALNNLQYAIKSNQPTNQPTIKFKTKSLLTTHLKVKNADICRCLPPDTTWHKVKSPKAD